MFSPVASVARLRSNQAAATTRHALDSLPFDPPCGKRVYQFVNRFFLATSQFGRGGLDRFLLRGRGGRSGQPLAEAMGQALEANAEPRQNEMRGQREDAQPPRFLPLHVASTCSTTRSPAAPACRARQS